MSQNWVSTKDPDVGCLCIICIAFANPFCQGPDDLDLSLASVGASRLLPIFALGLAPRLWEAVSGGINEVLRRLR